MKSAAQILSEQMHVSQSDIELFATQSHHQVNWVLRAMELYADQFRPAYLRQYATPDVLTEPDFIAAICHAFDIDHIQMFTRKRPFTYARYLHMTVRREAFRLSYADTAAVYLQTHCNAIHAVKTIKDLRATDKEFRAKTDRVMEMIEKYIEHTHTS